MNVPEILDKVFWITITKESRNSGHCDLIITKETAPRNSG